MQTLTRAALAPLLLLVLAGCSDLLGTGSGDAMQRRRLAEARALWETRAPASYGYVLNLSCACVPDGPQQAVRVTVENGVARMEYVTGDGSPSAGYAAYASVPALFAAVDAAISRDVSVLQVGYDPVFGYPDRLNVVYAAGNEQVVFLITGFEVPTD